MKKPNYEIEKKFIIKYPDLKILKSISEYTEIEQIYLLNDEGFSERIRKRGKDGDFKYYHTLKKRVSAIRRIEEERLISEEEYEKLKERANPKLNTIYKTRYCIPHFKHVLEIDVFPFWKKQAFLEIELKDEDEKYELPEYLEIIDDVSENGAYTNRALAELIPDET